MTRTYITGELRCYSLLENTFLFWNFVEANLLICQNECNKNISNFRWELKNLANCTKGDPVLCFEKMHVYVYKVSYCEKCWMFQIVLTLKDPFISERCIEIKIELNFYFHTSLWCLKRFYEGLWGLRKTFWGTTKNCENKNLTLFFHFVQDWTVKG